MRIVHVAPYAPGRCGLYETARDLMAAEEQLGHETAFVDSGVEGETRQPHDPQALALATVVVTHTAPPPDLERQIRAPIVHVLHGRPRSSFLLEQRDPKRFPVWGLAARWARDPQRALLVNLWPEHHDAWSCVIPKEKLVTLSAPPCDRQRFSPYGPEHTFSPGASKAGANVLVADMWREDVDPFHVLVALATHLQPPSRLHVYGLRQPLGPLEHVLRRARERGVLGETKGQMREIERVYRAACVVASPHRIATRVIREALACGVPVVSPGPWAGIFQADPEDPIEFTEAVMAAGKGGDFEGARQLSACFDSLEVARELLAAMEEALCQRTST